LDKERLKAYGVGTIKKLKSLQFCKKMEEKKKKQKGDNEEKIRNRKKSRTIEEKI
jgi:hypothetical protein